jgi:outer membrane lipoprotein carrier protein
MMRRPGCIALAAAGALALLPGALPAAAQSADATPAVVAQSDPAALERVERYVASLRSAQAAFSQTLSDPAGKVLQKASGTLYLQKPGRFRWDYSEPAGQLIVADGRNLWLYDADLGQVTVKPAAAVIAASPAMLLAGAGRVGDAFIAGDGGRERGLDWVRLLPRVADGDFRSVRLGFAGGQLAAMELEDRLRQTTRLEFVRLQRNPRLDAGLFRFVPPPGVDVVGTPASP